MLIYLLFLITLWARFCYYPDSGEWGNSSMERLGNLPNLITWQISGGARSRVCDLYGHAIECSFRQGVPSPVCHCTHHYISSVHRTPFFYFPLLLPWTLRLSHWPHMHLIWGPLIQQSGYAPYSWLPLSHVKAPLPTRPLWRTKQKTNGVYLPTVRVYSSRRTLW